MLAPAPLNQAISIRERWGTGSHLCVSGVEVGSVRQAQQMFLKVWRRIRPSQLHETSDSSSLPSLLPSFLYLTADAAEGRLSTGRREADATPAGVTPTLHGWVRAACTGHQQQGSRWSTSGDLMGSFKVPR